MRRGPVRPRTVCASSCTRPTLRPGAIKQPLVEIGHADLIDERASSPNSAGLRFLVVSGGVTVLEYSFEISGLVVAPALAVQGFMSDGTERVNFELALHGAGLGARRHGDARSEARIAVAELQCRDHARGGRR